VPRLFRPTVSAEEDGILDPEFRILDASREFLGHFAATRADVIGRQLPALFCPPVSDRLRAALTDLAADRYSWVSERLDAAGHAVPAPVRLVIRRAPEPSPSRALVLKLERPAAARPALSALAARVLEGVAAGDSSARLATRLHLSRQGVEYHVTALLRRLDAPNRACLVSRAYAMGVLRSDCWPPRVTDEWVS